MSVRGDFNLHERLARRRDLERRLNRASLAAVCTAVAVWLLALPFPWQAAAVASLAGVAFLLPVRGARAWSLTYIRSGSGLAYETALELESLPRDDFGLRSAVRSRARSGIAGLEAPRYTEWWLAGFVLAVAMLMLPLLRVAPPWNPVGPTPPATEAAAGQDDDAASPEPEEETEDQQAEAAEDEAVADDRLVAPPPPEDDGGAFDGGADRAEQPAEGDVLDRFLDNLRSRPEPQVSDVQQVPLGDPVPGEAEDQPTEPGDGDEDTQESGEQGDQDSDQASGDAPPQDDDLGDEGEQGADLGDENDQDAGDDSGSPQGEEGGADPGADSAETDAGADSELDSGMAEGDQGESGAGMGPGAVGIEFSEPLGAEGEEEFLEGILSGSEMNLGGDVRLPGFTDVELPPGTTPASLGQAVERAITEGTVPLEYQEVIRDYFR